MSVAANVNLPNKKRGGKKRQRSENWLEEDKHLLTELVRERVAIIENKNTDTNTNSKKLAAWSDLANSFNSMCKGCTRTLAQLKAQWGIIKMSKKKKKADERKLTFMTGGGPPPPREPEDGNDISVWLPSNEFVTDQNKFDSDQINQTSKIGKPSPDQIKTFYIDRDDKDNVSIADTPDIVTVNSAVEEVEEILEVQETKSINQTPLRQIPSKNKYSRREDKNRITTYSEQIAATEIKCRTELHEAQMENEKQKQKNLVLKEILIKKKIEYYEKRLNAIL